MEKEREHRSGNGGEFLFANYCNGMEQRSGNRNNHSNVLDRGPGNRNFNYFDDNCHRDYGDSASPMTKHLLPVSLSSPPASTSSLLGYIEHPVSKFDTLAGVAIRYGVEVADIKRLNGLVTDIQMFALKSLHIPLSGRHPPSTCLSNGFDDRSKLYRCLLSHFLAFPQQEDIFPPFCCHRQSTNEWTPPNHVHGNLFDSFQSLRLKSSQQKVSPAMSSLQGYYGLNSNDQITKSEAIEMAVLEKGESHYLEDELFIRTKLGANSPFSRHRKSKSLVIDFPNEKGDTADQMTSTEESSNGRIEKLVRRHQKSEDNFMAMTPEVVMNGDTGVGGGGFSTTAGKGLALRSKATIRTSILANTDMYPTGLGDLVGPLSSVRKSSSTSSLQDQETTSLSSIWSTSKRNLKPDLQSLSTAATTRSIFDGLPRPLTSRRNKTALD